MFWRNLYINYFKFLHHGTPTATMLNGWYIGIHINEDGFPNATSRKITRNTNISHTVSIGQKIYTINDNPFVIIRETEHDAVIVDIKNLSVYLVKENDKKLLGTISHDLFFHNNKDEIYAYDKNLTFNVYKIIDDEMHVIDVGIMIKDYYDENGIVIDNYLPCINKNHNAVLYLTRNGYIIIKIL